MIAYRVTTHDFRPPVQGGDPVPHIPGEILPIVELDTSNTECAAGRSACHAPHPALRIAGLWPNGRPSRLWKVESVIGHDVIERGDKLRAGTWKVLAEEPVSDSILADLHRPMAGDGLTVEEIVAEVQMWRAALARPGRDPAAVGAGLQAALGRRGLPWKLKQFPSTQNAWDARAAGYSWAAGHSWAAWAAGYSWAAWAARDARSARSAWNARDAGYAGYAWNARDDRDAWDAWDAMTVCVATRRGWWRTPEDSDLLTVGIRDAYVAGLGIAVPTGEKELGWAMDENP